MDDRQHIPSTVSFDYTSHLKDDVKGMRIGLVKEGFDLKDSNPDVNSGVKKAANHFTSLVSAFRKHLRDEKGAVVEEVSIPMHSIGTAIWSAIALEGSVEQMMFGNGYGTGHKELFVTSLLDSFAGWKQKANEVKKKYIWWFLLSN